VPYRVVHRQDNARSRRYCLQRKDGSIKSCHASKNMANKAIGAIYASKHRYKMANRRGGK
jgi:hypothetical protein